MLYQILADFIVILHFAFIVFVLGGGILVIKWRWIIWLHIPAVIWGALISFFGWICPLTPIENMLRQVGRGEEYLTGFIEHYLLPVIYPSGLDRKMYIVMGIFVLVFNLAIYALLIAKFKRLY